jgi:hypothetical protein
MAHGMLWAFTGVLPACGAEGNASSDDALQAPGNVAGVQQALWEDSCWTSTWPDKIVDAANPPTVTQFVQSSASYDHASCPNQFVVDFDEMSGKGFRVDAIPAAQPYADSTWCSGYWAKTEVRGWTGSQWVLTDYWTEAGQWHPTSMLRSCVESLTFGGGGAFHPDNHGFTAIRIVTQAGFANTYQPVYVTVALWP